MNNTRGTAEVSSSTTAWIIGVCILVFVVIIVLVLANVLYPSNTDLLKNNPPSIPKPTPKRQPTPKGLGAQDTSEVPVISLKTNSSTNSYDGTNPLLLYWSVTNNPTSIYFTSPSTMGYVSNNSFVNVTPQFNTTYTLAAANANGSAQPVSVQVISQSPPVINGFSSTAPLTGIGLNSTVTFSWNVSLADTVTLTFNPQGSIPVVSFDLQSSPNFAINSYTTTALKGSNADGTGQVQAILQASKSGLAPVTSTISINVISKCPTVASVFNNYTLYLFGTVAGFARAAISESVQLTGSGAGQSYPLVMYGLDINNKQGVWASIDGFQLTTYPYGIPAGATGYYTNYVQFAMSLTSSADLCVSQVSTIDASMTLYVLQETTPTAAKIYSLDVFNASIFVYENYTANSSILPVPNLYWPPEGTTVAGTTVVNVTCTISSVDSICYDTLYVASNDSQNTATDIGTPLCFTGGYSTGSGSAAVFGVFRILTNNSIRLIRTIPENIVRYTFATINDPNEYVLLRPNDPNAARMYIVTPNPSPTTACALSPLAATNSSIAGLLIDFYTNGFTSIGVNNSYEIGYVIGSPYPPYQANFI